MHEIGERLESQKKTAKRFVDTKMDVKLKLAVLWASVMFCYVYADFLSLYKPGYIEEIIAGETPVGSQESLLAAAMLMAIPSLMIFLSVALPAKANRPANILMGIVYTVVNLGLNVGGNATTERDAYYLFFGVVETVVTVLIIWYAWKWPEQRAVAQPA